MKKIIVFLFVFIFMLLSYKNKKVVVDEEKNIVKVEPVESENLKINILHNDEIINEDLENYVIGVVACEMPASFNYEALKAMSVASRTFALYKMKQNKDYDLTSTTSDQCYITIEEMKENWGTNFEKNYNLIKKSVIDTKNEYMTYNDEVIISFYFSISNGYTENCENVFVQKLDYLVSVDSQWDKNLNYKEKDVTFTIESFLNKLDINSSSIDKIDIDRSKTGRINKITINNKTFKGTKFRTLLSLRSTDVEIKYDKENVYITTKGYGHGVGMSQYGANEMAKLGYTYDEILKHYYSGIEIMNKL